MSGYQLTKTHTYSYRLSPSKQQEAKLNEILKANGSLIFKVPEFEIVDNEKASNPKNKLLKLSIVGEDDIFVKIIYHRPLTGIAKSCVVANDEVGNWYANIQIEVLAFSSKLVQPDSSTNMAKPRMRTVKAILDINDVSGNNDIVSLSLKLNSLLLRLLSKSNLVIPEDLQKKLKNLQRQCSFLMRKDGSVEGSGQSNNYRKQLSEVAKLYNSVLSHQISYAD